MNLQQFNDNFSVTVVQFDNTTSNALVNFKVQCLVNSRVSIHTATVDTTLLSEGFNDLDVVAAGWENIKTTVNTWATFNLSENSLSVISIASTSNLIDVSTFNSNFTVKVIRFELIPNINPTDWCIQLSVGRNDKNLSANFEGLIPLDQAYCNNTLCSDIALTGWELVKEKACEWAFNNMPTVGVVDKTYVPVSI